MKRLFYLIFILLPATLFCQHTFELKIKTELDDLAVDIIQYSDGNYICAGSKKDNILQQSNGIIYKISPEG
nr:hypothetical protein [Bacteroidota bacterium]